MDPSAGTGQTTTNPLGAIREAIGRAVAAVGADPGGRITLERPPRAEMGDYSTNAALIIAPVLKCSPREAAARLAEGVAAELGAAVERTEVAGPGFLNLFMSDAWYREVVGALIGAGDAIGAGEPRSQSIVLEFVSANPTGPLTAAGGRHAAYGDSLARILHHTGYQVQRHYYINDSGGQIDNFARSIAARMRGEEPPEDGYHGDYVIALAEELSAAGATPDSENLAELGVEAMLGRIGATLERFGVSFDVWRSERALYAEGAVDRILVMLREAGHVYESEGATWLRASALGDDKDRVLIRSTGEPTYLTPDIAYHLEKLTAGDHLINVLGADHHGYLNRMRAAIAAVGGEPDRFEAVVMQLVNIVERGERAQMSKRKGDFVALDELLDDIGTDAARFFMVQRSHDTTFDLDLDLARRQKAENPVFYVQYAHARIAAILRKAEEQGAGTGEAGPYPIEPAERELVKRIAAISGEVSSAAELRAPHRLVAYAGALAADFHVFYDNCQVIGAGEGAERGRLEVCLAAKSAIARTLDLLGVSAPERM